MRRHKSRVPKISCTLESAQTSPADSGQASESFARVRSQTECTRTFAHFRLGTEHTQAQSQSAKSFVALWNLPKHFLETLGKAASRLRALNRKLNVPRNFAHLRSSAAHAKENVQSAKSFLALWNRP